MNPIKLRWAGTYLDGSPCEGSIEIEYLGPVLVNLDDPTPVTMYPAKFRLHLVPTLLDTETVGYAEVRVPASNDETLTGHGGVYRLTERLKGGGGRADVVFVVDKDTPGGEVWINAVPTGAEGSVIAPSPVYRAEFMALADRIDALDEAVAAQQTQINGKQPSGAYVLSTDSRLSDARTPKAHTHTWTQITDKPNTYPATTHGHTIAQVTGLQAIINDLTTRVKALEDSP